VGVGPENKKINYIEEFVMGRFSKEEKKKLEEVIKQVIEEVNKLVK
jgi:peptidyl-tRNA hydrolase